MKTNMRKGHKSSATMRGQPVALGTRARMDAKTERARERARMAEVKQDPEDEDEEIIEEVSQVEAEEIAAEVVTAVEPVAEAVAEEESEAESDAATEDGTVETPETAPMETGAVTPPVEIAVGEDVVEPDPIGEQGLPTVNPPVGGIDCEAKEVVFTVEPSPPHEVEFPAIVQDLIYPVQHPTGNAGEPGRNLSGGWS